MVVFRLPVIGLTMAAAVASTLIAGCSGGAVVACKGFSSDQSVTNQSLTGPAGVQPVQSLKAVSPGAAVAPATTSPSLPQTATVTLPTGDKVRLDRTASGTYTVVPVLPKAGTTVPDMVQFSYGGDQYAVPDDAVPYLGSTLDPRLFDVSYLVRAGLDDAKSATLPVAITYSGASAAVPGAQVKTRTGDVATATLTKSQAIGLGTLLNSRWRAARAGTRPTLPGIARIGLTPPAGTTALPYALPQVPAGPHNTGLHYHTLTLKLIDLNGQPGTAVGWLQNVDDARLGSYFIEPDLTSGATGTQLGEQGPISFSVPDGTYSIQFAILSAHPGTRLGVDAALVVKPQVTIDSDQTITLDARTAKPYQAAVTGTTGETRADWMEMTRSSATGDCGTATGAAFGLVSVSGLGDGPSELLATPTDPVTKGTMGFSAHTAFEDQPPSTTPSAKPVYYLDFPSQNRIPASLDYAIKPADLTALHEQVYDNAGSTCYQPEFLPMLYEAWGDQYELAAEPYISRDFGPHTDYFYSSAPKLDRWQIGYNAANCSRRWDAPRAFTHGEQLTEAWDKGPLVPSPAATSVDIAGVWDANTMATLCPACRQDDNGMVYLTPWGDSDPTHYFNYSSFGNRPGGAFVFYRNGTPAIDDNTLKGGPYEPYSFDLPLLPQAATYRLDWTQTLGDGTPASNDTDWTFHSSRSDPLKTSASEGCAPDATRACSFLPMLFVSYDLALNYQSQAPAGTSFPITFTVEHQQGEPSPTGLAATVAVSFDDGKTWSAPQSANSLGGGRFATTVDQPALSATTGFVSLRVQAHDGAGNSVTQTIIRAYGLTG